MCVCVCLNLYPFVCGGLHSFAMVHVLKSMDNLRYGSSTSVLFCQRQGLCFWLVLLPLWGIWPASIW